MAEEKPDGEFPRSDQAKDVPLATTPEADVSQDIIEDKAPIPRAPNTALLVLSWCVFATGLYIVCTGLMDWYKDTETEPKIWLTIILASLTGAVGKFLRDWAYHGIRKAVDDSNSKGSFGQGDVGDF